MHHRHATAIWRCTKPIVTLQRNLITKPEILSTKHQAQAHPHPVISTVFAATPSIAQYLRVRDAPEYRGCVILFQLGGFYEAFFNDAIRVADVCGITLTVKGGATYGGLPIPMAGVPVDRADTHVGKLLRHGWRVVLVDQTEGLLARGGVVSGNGISSGSVLSRRVSRVLTPGTAPELWSNAPASNHYVAALAVGHNNDGIVAIAAADLATGSLSVRAVAAADVGAALASLAPVEIVLPSATPDVGPPSIVRINDGGSIVANTIEYAAREAALLSPSSAGANALGALARVRRISTAQHHDNGNNNTLRVSRIGGTDGALCAFVAPDAFTPSAGLAAARALPHAAVALASDLARFSDVELSALGGLITYITWTLAGRSPRLGHPTRVEAAVSTSTTNINLEDSVAMVTSSVLSLEKTREETQAAMTMLDREVPPHEHSINPLNSSLVARLSTRVRTPPRMLINEPTARALELVRTSSGPRRSRGSLLALVDRCRSFMGSRLLDARICSPLASLEPVLHRLDAVEAFADNPRGSSRDTVEASAGGSSSALAIAARTNMRRVTLRAIAAVPDLERAFQRIATLPRPAPRDLAILRDGLSAAHRLGLLVSSWDAALFSGIETTTTTTTTTTAAAATATATTAVNNSIVSESGVAAGSGGISRVTVAAIHSASLTSATRLADACPADISALLLAASRADFDITSPPPPLPSTSLSSSSSSSISSLNAQASSAVLTLAAAVLSTPLDDFAAAVSGAEASANWRIKYGTTTANGSIPDANSDAGVAANAISAFSALRSTWQELAAALTVPAGNVNGDGGVEAPIGGTCIARGYDVALDAARDAAADSAGAVTVLEDRVRVLLSLPHGAPAVRLRRFEKDGLLLEIDVRARPVRAALDAVLAAQRAIEVEAVAAAAAQRLVSGGGIARSLVSRPSITNDLTLRSARSTMTLQRFRCDALSRLEASSAEAAARATALETAIINALAERVLAAEPAIKAVARAVAVIDVSVSLAQLAAEAGLTRPIVTARGVHVRSRGIELGVPPSSNVSDVGSGELVIRGLRHLGVEDALWRAAAGDGGDGGDGSDNESDSIAEEKDMEGGGGGGQVNMSVTSVGAPRHTRFVANDVVLGHPTAIPGALDGARTALLLGPNMGGKSTYLRSVAHAVVLAQCGSFIPASFGARIGIVDSLFARVGASDELARHRSTFMVEMEETASLLRGAGKNALVLVDEVGRGTAVADGLAVGVAVLEALAKGGSRDAPRALFASHFPELAAVALDSTTPGAVRVNVMAWAPDSALTVTHRVALHAVHAAHGESEVLDALGVSVSHGLVVANHAGLPRSVLDRAKVVLDALNASGVPRAWGAAVRAAVAIK